MDFARPSLLLLLWLTPVLAVLAVACRRTWTARLARFADAGLLPRLAPAPRNRRFGLQAVLALCGFALLVLALAGPRWGPETVWVPRHRIVLALDVSRSMLVADAEPSRLERARAEISDLLRRLEGERTALLAFRRQPRLLCPFTPDNDFVRHALAAAGPWSAPPGPTDIGAALNEAVALLRDEDADDKLVILVTDGEDLEGRGRDAAREAARHNIRIVAVAVGTPRGGRIPSGHPAGGWVARDGQPVVSRPDTGLLRELAALTGGACLSTTAGLLPSGAVRGLPGRGASGDAASPGLAQRPERYAWFATPALLCLLLCIGTSRGRLRRRPSAVRALLWAALLTAAAGPLRAQQSDAARGTNTRDPDRVQEQAYERFRDGDPAGARAAFLYLAERDAQPQRARWLYNAAVCARLANDADGALQILSSPELTRDPRAQFLAALTLLARAETPAGDGDITSRKRFRLTQRAAELLRPLTSPDLPVAAEARRAFDTALGRLAALAPHARLDALSDRHADTADAALADKLYRRQLRAARGIRQGFAAPTPDTLNAVERHARTLAELSLLGRILQQRRSDARDTEAARAASAYADAAAACAAAAFDLDAEAVPAADRADTRAFALWRLLAAPLPLAREALCRQTQAGTLLTTKPAESASQQAAVHDLTARLARHADLREPPTPAAPSGKPAAAIRERIRKAAAEALGHQQAARQALDAGRIAAASTAQQASRDLLETIVDLLTADTDTAAGRPPDIPPAGGAEDTPPPPDAPPPDTAPAPPGDPPAPGMMTPAEIDQLIERARKREQEHARRLQRRGASMSHSGEDHDW